MRKAFSVVVVLVRCGVLGGFYGAAFGGIYSLLPGAVAALRSRDPFYFYSELPLAIPVGALIGYMAGFLSGVVGGCLGGPVGCAIAGAIGPGAIMRPWLGGIQGLCFARPEEMAPIVLGAAFGLVLGLHIRRRVSLFPGVERLADDIYKSPLGGWLGWRHRDAQ